MNDKKKWLGLALLGLLIGISAFHSGSNYTESAALRQNLQGDNLQGDNTQAAPSAETQAGATPSSGGATAAAAPQTDGTAAPAQGAAKPTEPKGVKLPYFTVRNEQGQPVDLAQYHGKVLLVNFWATWCPPCVAEMPSLDHLSKIMQGQDFAVLTISEDRGGLPTVERFYARSGLKSLPILTDAASEVGDLLDVRALPTTILVDRDGRELARLEGGTQWDSAQAVAMIRKTLAMQ